MNDILNDKITAVLGPTNTGKTHYAIERMLSYNNGIIGLPLRLLAREVYDRIVKLRDVSSVALVTGEERIIPKKAKTNIIGKSQYFFLTLKNSQNSFINSYIKIACPSY